MKLLLLLITMILAATSAHALGEKNWGQIGAACSWRDGCKGASTIKNVDDYGAAGNGSTWDHKAFRAAIAAAGVDGTVSLTHGKTYVLCTTVTVKKDGLTIEGNGATVLRCPENITVLTVDANQGATSVTVQHPERFEVGMWIAFAKAPGGFGDTGAGFRPIEDITGDVLSFNANQVVGVSPSVTTSFVIGDSVFTVPQLFRIQDAHDFTMKNLILDGNASNHSVALNWVWSSHIVFRGVSLEDQILDATIDNVDFHDLFGDGIGVSMSRRLTLKNSTFADLAGPAIHLTKMFDTEILNNVFERTSTEGDRETHADGAIEFSLFNEDTLIEGNTISDIHTESNVGEAIGLVALGSNRGVTIRNNTISDVDVFTVFELVDDKDYVQGTTEDIIVEGNTVTDAGRLFIRTVAANTDDILENVTITGNTMTNSHIEIKRATDVTITGNSITFDPGTFVAYSVFENAIASISLANVRNATISGNTITGNHKGIFAHNFFETTFQSQNVLIENNHLAEQQDHCVAIGQNAQTDNDDGVDPRFSYEEFTFRNNTCISSALDSVHSADDFIAWFGRRAIVTGNCFLSNADGLNVSGTFGGSGTPGSGLNVSLNTILAASGSVVGGTTDEFNDLSFTGNIFSDALSSTVLASEGLINTGNTIDAVLAECPVGTD